MIRSCFIKKCASLHFARRSIADNSDQLLASESETDFDEVMRERVERARTKRCVPRQVSTIDVKTGDIGIRILDVPYGHVFATNPPGTECFRFFTRCHNVCPLVVAGSVAGYQNTASALLSEALGLGFGLGGKKAGGGGNGLSRMRGDSLSNLSRTNSRVNLNVK